MIWIVCFVCLKIKRGLDYFDYLNEYCDIKKPRVISIKVVMHIFIRTDANATNDCCKSTNYVRFDSE